MRSLLLVCALLVGGNALEAAAIVLDPGFEQQNGNWTFAGSSGLHGFNHTGSLSAIVYCDRCDLGTTSSVSQTVATTAGNVYSVDFWLSPDSCCDSFSQGGAVTVAFGNTVGFSRSAQFFPLATFQEYSFTSTATGASTTFSFSALGLASGTVFIDDINIQDLGPAETGAPEPATWLTGGAALLGVLLFRGRRSRLAVGRL